MTPIRFRRKATSLVLADVVGNARTIRMMLWDEPKEEPGTLNHKKILTLIACGVLALAFSGCGDTYELQSISIDPTHPSVVGIGGTAQITVTAHYSNNKTSEETRRATYRISAPLRGSSFAPLSAITINANGLVEALNPGACTWTVTGTSPNWEYGTDPYILDVSFGGKTVQGYISVASITGCYSPDMPKPSDPPQPTS